MRKILKVLMVGVICAIMSIGFFGCNKTEGPWEVTFVDGENH